MQSTSDSCKWCRHNPYRAVCDVDNNCSFKTLDYEKDAIILRLKEEAAIISAMKIEIFDVVLSGRTESIEDSSVINDFVDCVKGVEIMVHCLKTEFGVQDNELKTYIVVPSTSFMQRARLVAKLSVFRKSRGGRKNG